MPSPTIRHGRNCKYLHKTSQIVPLVILPEIMIISKKSKTTCSLLNQCECIPTFFSLSFNIDTLSFIHKVIVFHSDHTYDQIFLLLFTKKYVLVHRLQHFIIHSLNSFFGNISIVLCTAVLINPINYEFIF